MIRFSKQAETQRARRLVSALTAALMALGCNRPPEPPPPPEQVAVEPLPHLAGDNFHYILRDFHRLTSGALTLAGLDAVAIEADSDKDGIKELYIASVQQCHSWLKIIRVIPGS